MNPQADRTSARAVGGFATKMLIAGALAMIVGSPKLMAMAGYLSLLAWFTAILALLRGHRLDPEAFNGWDEVLWLMFAAHGLRLVHYVSVPP